MNNLKTYDNKVKNMAGLFKNKHKVFRGAFVEYEKDSQSHTPLKVVFQFNPIQLTRNRSISYAPPNEKNIYPSYPGEDKLQEGPVRNLREYHHNTNDLLEIRDNQNVTINEESIGLELRLDATEDLNEVNPKADQYGILPHLATLEMMVYPKGDSLTGENWNDLLDSNEGISFTKSPNPPMILFIWGANRVMPININAMNITEIEFNPLLNPVRATVTVNFTVIEGRNKQYMYYKAKKEEMSDLYLANNTEVANVVIPG